MQVSLAGPDPTIAMSPMHPYVFLDQNYVCKEKGRFTAWHNSDELMPIVSRPLDVVLLSRKMCRAAAAVDIWILGVARTEYYGLVRV